jgi:hypothetical protein
MSQNRTLTVASLGIAQTLAWASSYYLPAILAVPMARDLGVGTPTVFFSRVGAAGGLPRSCCGRMLNRRLDPGPATYFG